MRSDHSTADPISLAAQQRISRGHAFDSFRDAAKTRLMAARERLPRVEVFAQHYSFNVCPGGSQGGLDENMVEVFFGARVIGQQPRSATSRGVAFYAERGAELIYERQVTGQVRCYLVSAWLQVQSVDPKTIVLGVYDSADELIQSELVHHLRYLVAYLAVTMLDDAATPVDRARYVVLWALKHYYVTSRDPDGSERLELRPPRLWQGLVWAGRWAATIGLSGALLFALQRCVPQEDGATSVMQSELRTFREDVARLAATQAKHSEIAATQRESAAVAVTEMVEQLRALRIELVEDRRTGHARDATEAADLAAGADSNVLSADEDSSRSVQ